MGLCQGLDCDTCIIENCEVLELAALKRDYKDCEKEHILLINQYKSLLKQNEELQNALVQKCKDCDSEARLKLATIGF